MTFYLDDELRKYFSADKSLFDQLMTLRGECYRHLDGRKTQKVKLGDKYYFIKQHNGVGWKEILKNILQLRLPVVSARNEWCAIKKLQSLGVGTAKVVAYGERGINPASRQSFVLMEELAAMQSLEELCRRWQPKFTDKRELIERAAQIARTMHGNGINHRDFYICHLLMDVKKTNQLYLIDLHRAQLRHAIPKRWVIKDVSGLYFSSMDAGLTKRDLFRFMKAYRQQPLRDILNRENHFWQKVNKRAEQLYRDHNK